MSQPFESFEFKFSNITHWMEYSEQSGIHYRFLDHVGRRLVGKDESILRFGFSALLLKADQYRFMKEKVMNATNRVHEVEKRFNQVKRERDELSVQLATAREECERYKQDSERLQKAFDNLRAERNRPAEFWKNTNPRQG